MIWSCARLDLEMVEISLVSYAGSRTGLGTMDFVKWGMLISHWRYTYACAFQMSPSQSEKGLAGDVPGPWEG